MDIKVVSSIGTGKTALSAFDNALKNAGVYNFNLIVLSSIIPSGAKVTKHKRLEEKDDEIGWRLYVVKADQRSDRSGEVIAAGLGWYHLQNGGGVFVEHEVSGMTKKSVESDIKLKIARSVQDLVEFRGEKFHKDKMGVSFAVAKVDSEPACALTLAVYKSESW